MATTFVRGHVDTFLRSLDRKLEPPVKQHLKQVYTTLATATFIAAVGSYVHLFTDIMSGGIMASLGAMGFALAITMTPDTGKNADKRYYYMLGFAGCTGLALGPLLDLAMYLNPRLIPMAFVSTCLVFASFSLSSIFSTHHKWLYLTGGLMSLLSLMLFTSIINIFIGSYFLFQAQMYLGLIVFCIFVMYDTAVIIEKRRMGDTDYIKHSMLLFTDFVELFRTLLVLLMQKERDRNNNSRSNRSRR
jgi:FtsH-binding integral membrane protein